MRTAKYGLTTTSLVTFAILVTSACGGSGIANTPPSTGAQPYVHTVSNGASFQRQADMTGDVEVACPAHEIALGGGYGFVGGAGDNPYDNPPFAYAASASASFPYENGWKIQFSYSMSRDGHVDATAYVQCLVGGLGALSVYGAEFDLPNGATVAGMAPCPAGTTVVGGGFSTHQGISERFSLPELSPAPVWQVTFVNQSGQDFIQGGKVYASCYGLPQSASTTLGTHGIVSQPLGAYPSTRFEARCDEGTSLTAGGYERPSNLGDVRTDAPTSAGTGWEIVEPGNAATVEFEAIAECVVFSNASFIASVVPTHVPTKLVPTATLANPPTATPRKVPPKPSVHEVAQATTLSGGNTGPATATCPVGEQALGGGWSVPTAQARVFAAQLSGTTWSVSVQPLGHPASTAVTVYVECLANAPGAVVTQRSANSSTQPNAVGVAAAACNGGETPVGGGFNLSASATSLELRTDNPQTFESGVWWAVYAMNHDSVAHPFTAYVECLSHVSASPTYPGKLGTYVYASQTGGVAVSCPSGSVPAGGGLDYTAQSIGNLYFLRATSTGWQGSIYGVTGYGLVPLVPTVWAVCLHFS